MTLDLLAQVRVPASTFQKGISHEAVDKLVLLGVARLTLRSRQACFRTKLAMPGAIRSVCVGCCRQAIRLRYLWVLPL